MILSSHKKPPISGRLDLCNGKGCILQGGVYLAYSHRDLMEQKIKQAEQKQLAERAKADAEKVRQEQARKQSRIETRRFWIQTGITALAAVAALLGVLLQRLT